MKECISARGLRFRDLICYPQLIIEQGAFTFITGESGCGKSSLFRLLNATERPSAGDIFYYGVSICNVDVIVHRRRVLLAPQEVFLLEDSIRGNFAFFYESREQTPPTDDEILGALRVCQLDLSPDTLCTPLSGGERQRVFLAIFLSLTTEVLLLDEPTAALDEVTAAALLGALKEYATAHGITVAVICHSKVLTQRFADRIIPLERRQAE